MDKIVIDGGIPLNGKVQISGSKNSVLPCLFATLLTDEDCKIKNVPLLDDIDTACSLLTVLGKKVLRTKDEILISSGKTLYTHAPYELVRRMRASALVLGPLLARAGFAAASLPGGCAIGNRPIDIHIAGLEKLGAESQIEDGLVQLKAKKLVGKKIVFKFPSVGATENLLMASVLAEGETVIVNAAREPEIVDLAGFLKKMGAEINGAGSSTIRICGKKKLYGTSYRVIPDRIETSTYLIAALSTMGTVELNGVEPSHVRAVLKSLRKAGAKIEQEDSTLFIKANAKKIKPANIVTGTFPNFPTDVQAQWMALMSQANGKSVITENIFENRFMHVAELCRMGAQIKVMNNRAYVQGVENLSGTNVMVSDLRAGAALVIAGLMAKGRTIIHRIYHLDRGYEKLEQKLKSLGARIKRVK